MSKIFISYRRSETETMAGRIYERLKSTFGSDDVFLDTEGVGVGPFPLQIENALKRAKVFLILIGDQWATVVDKESGLPRLNNPEDWVRKEVETALQRYRLAPNEKDRVVIIPILVNGAQMPSKSVLPHSLQALTDFSAYPVRSGIDFSSDMDRLIEQIVKFVPLPSDVRRPRKFPRLLVAVALAAFVIVLGLLFLTNPPLIYEIIGYPPTPTVTANGATQTPEVTSATAPQTETATPSQIPNQIRVTIETERSALTMTIQKPADISINLSPLCFIRTDATNGSEQRCIDAYFDSDWQFSTRGHDTICMIIDYSDEEPSSDECDIVHRRENTPLTDLFWWNDEANQIRTFKVVYADTLLEECSGGESLCSFDLPNP